jgi:hypothetical protein
MEGSALHRLSTSSSYKQPSRPRRAPQPGSAAPAACIFRSSSRPVPIGSRLSSGQPTTTSVPIAPRLLPAVVSSRKHRALLVLSDGSLWPWPSQLSPLHFHLSPPGGRPVSSRRYRAPLVPSGAPRLSGASLGRGLCCLCCLCYHHSRTPTSPCACPPLAGSPPSGGDLLPLMPLIPAIRATPRYRPLACPAAPILSVLSVRSAHPHLTMRYLSYRPWPLRSTLHSPRSTAGKRMAKRETPHRAEESPMAVHHEGAEHAEG